MSYTLKFTRKGEEYAYTLSDEDILSLYQATYKEGANNLGVVWSLLNRFAWLYPEGIYPTLEKYVIAYAQPINPLWFPSGSKYKLFVSDLRNKYSGEVLADKLRKALKSAEERIIFAKLTKSEIPQRIIDLVDSVLNGKSQKIKGVLHYIFSMAPNNATEKEAKQIHETYAKTRNLFPISIESSKSKFNWFFSVEKGKNFSIDIVTNAGKQKLINIGMINDPKAGIVMIAGGLSLKKIASLIGGQVL